MRRLTEPGRSLLVEPLGHERRVFLIRLLLRKEAYTSHPSLYQDASLAEADSSRQLA